MPIFHLATAADWAEAERSGRYTTSTLGRTLAEEGFIHASRADQWQGVRERFYGEVTEPLVLLVIDPARLDAPVVEEPGDASRPDGETFPHVYGAIPVAAVTRVIPLGSPADAARPDAAPSPVPASTPTARPTPRPDAGRTFWSLFLEEMGLRAALGVAVIVVSVALCLLVLWLAGDFPALVTILVSLIVGLVVVQRVLRQRESRRD